MDVVAEHMQSVPPPNFTHYFAYGIDVSFRRDASDLAPLQRERIVSILKKPRDADPSEEWCVLLTGFDGTGEQAAALAKQRRDAVQTVVATHVPYRGFGPALSDLFGGQVDFLLTSPQSGLGQLKAGKLRALAVTARRAG